MSIKLKLTTMAFLAVIWSCSSVTVMRTKEMKAIGEDVKKDVNTQMRLQMDSLRHELDSLKAVNERLQRRIVADLGVVSNRLGSDMDRIDARLEEMLYRMDLIVDASKATAKRVVVDKRKESQTNAPQIQEETTNAQAPAQSPIQSTQAASTETPAVTGPVAEESELEKLYATARADFHRSEYKIAFDEFKQIYEKAGQSEMGENALYWMALCLFETQQQDKGQKVLQRILDQFPQGKKVCVTLFKLSQLSEQTGKRNDQVQYLQRLTAQPQCRESNEAFRAIDLLNQLLGPDGKIKTQPAVTTPPPAPVLP